MEDSLFDRYRAQTAVAGEALSLPDEIVGGAIATVVDAGTTLWNNPLMPKKLEASTEDLLARISPNALQVFQEHPDAIRAASFVAGSLLPIGLSIKGMNALRAGAKSVNWFSDAGKASRLAEVESAFKSGLGKTERLRDARISAYSASIGNQVADNVAAEAALLFTMSSHPYMEDYLKDPLENFSISMALGLAVGAPVGAIIAGKEIRNTIAPIEKELTATTSKLTVPLEVADNLGNSLLRAGQNIDNVEAYLAAAKSGQVDISDRTVGGLELLSRKWQAARADLAEEIFQGDLKNLDAADKTTLIELLSSDPRFAELHSASFYTVKDLDKVQRKGVLSYIPSFSQTSAKTGELEGKKVVYHPILDAFTTPEEATNFASVADTGASVASIEGIASHMQGVGKYARTDAALEHMTDVSALVDRDFAATFLAVDKMSFKELSAKPFVVASDDIATIKAYEAALQKFSSAGEDISGLKILVTDEAPSYAAVQKAQIRRAGLAPDYLKKMEELGKPENYSKFSHWHPTSPTKGILNSWVAFSPSVVPSIRRAATSLRSGTLQIGLSALDKDMVKELKALYSSSKSQEFRDTLRTELADAEGYVYLYRGLKSTPNGHSGLESYALSAVKAKEFARTAGTTHLYKVHVDDILAPINDIGKGYHPEILVLNPTREAVTEASALPIELAPKQESISIGAAEKEASNSSTFTAAEFRVFSQQAQAKRVQELLAEGYAPQSVAIRMGVPLNEDTLEAIEAGNFQHFVGLSKYSTAADVETALTPSTRALSMTTNVQKLKNAQVYATLNSRTMDTMSRGLVEQFLLTSSSSFVRESIAPFLLGKDSRSQLLFIEKELDNILPSQLLNKGIFSADKVTEELGSVSSLITTFGKGIVSLKNAAQEKFTAPISKSLAALSKDTAALIEFNTANEVQASVKGMKIYKAGRFWTPPGGGVFREDFETLLSTSDEEFVAWAETVGKDNLPNAESVKFKGTEYRVATASVDAAIKQMQEAGRHMYELKSVSYKIEGKGKLPDIGYWVPAANPTGKQIAYVLEQNGATKMILGKTEAELHSRIEEFKRLLGKDVNKVQIVLKGDDQLFFNKIASRHDEFFMGIADSSRLHGGSSAKAVISTSTEPLADIVQGLDYSLNRAIDKLTQLQLAPIMQRLDDLSTWHNYGFSTAALNTQQKSASKGIDPGVFIKNILLGRSSLSESSWWSGAQTHITGATDGLLRSISAVMTPFLRSGATRTEAEWKTLVQNMEDRGIINPFSILETELVDGTPTQTLRTDFAAGKEAFLRDGKLSQTGQTARMVATGNALAATVVLRAANLAQAVTNIVSLPILTSAAISRKLSASYMDGVLDPKARFAVIETMFDGARLVGHPTYGLHGKLGKMAIDRGAFKDDWREVNGILKEARNLEPGLTSKVEQALDSKLVDWLSGAADKSETFVRQQAFFTGAALAKKAYKGLSDEGIYTFARDFMDKAVGNYAASQRPIMFQGTVGVAFGLFQTYFLTMAQHIHGQIANRDWKALGKMLLAQQTIFGSASLPGFHPISELIGEHFSDQHFDLQTGFYRALPDEMANIILYGLPSQLVGITTRGDIQPRVPNPFQDGLGSIAALNIIKQGFDATHRVAEAAFTADANTGKAMLEALSLQTVSRPLARAADIMTGHSITTSGDIVTRSEDIFTLGNLSRIMAARPLEEIKARETFHLNSLYQSLDSNRRRKVQLRLKSYIENGNLDDAKLDALASEYLRTGTPQGWRSAVNKAIAMANRPAADTSRDKLKPDSPLNGMIDDLDGI